MSTYVKIAALEVGSGGAASMDFSSIPNTYTDLILKLSMRHASAADQAIGDIKVNGSISFSGKFVGGNGSVAFSQGTPAYGIVASNATASTFSNVEVYITNYIGSTYKSFSMDSVNENNATAAVASFFAGLWSTTSAINQITVLPYGGNFAQYTTATLYGIKNN